MRNARIAASGFTLLEALAVLAIMALGLNWFLSLQTDAATTSREKLAQAHGLRIAEAVLADVKTNTAMFLATATPTVAAKISMTDLRNGKFLLANVSDANAYGHTYTIKVLQPSAGVLNILMVSSGPAIPLLSLSRIAKGMGGMGGFVSPSAPTIAQGASGGWAGTVTLSTYGIPDGGGRLAALISFRDGQQVTDFLYRSAVTGHPEVNRMQAPLDMANNPIVNAGTFSTTGQVTGGAVSATGRMYAGEYVQITGVAVVGTGCTPNGLLGRESDGRLASCVSGVWRRAGF